MVSRYLSYYFRATTVRRIQSPFVKELLEATLEDDRQYYQFGEVEAIRKRMLKNTQTIEVTDYGAGSRISSTKTRKISDMAKSALSPPFYAQLLFRLVNYLKPKTILELGTCLGISTLYLYLPDRKAKVITMEGCPNIAKIAQNNFEQLKATDIKLINAPFDQALPTALKELESLDMIFIDGNHKREPTLFYFKQALEHANEQSCFIFHDIHWTEEMEGAWRDIKNHPKVKLTVDLFFMGLVFFHSDLETAEHFTVVRRGQRPWG